MPENQDPRMRGKEIGDALLSRRREAFKTMIKAVHNYVGMGFGPTRKPTDRSYDRLVSSVNDFLLIDAEVHLIQTASWVSEEFKMNVKIDGSDEIVTATAKTFAQAHHRKYGCNSDL